MGTSSLSGIVSQIKKRALILVGLLVVISLGGYMLLMSTKGGDNAPKAAGDATSQRVKIKISETPSVKPGETQAVASSAKTVDTPKQTATNNKTPDVSKPVIKTTAEKENIGVTKTEEKTASVDKAMTKASIKKEGVTAALAPVKEKPSTVGDKPIEKVAVKKDGQEKKKFASHTPKKSEKSRAVRVIQVGSFLQKKNADSRLRELTKAGYKAYISEADVFSKHWYRVKVGSYQTKGDAQKAADLMMKRFKIPSVLIIQNG